ncbi:MAG: hypothetical protein WC887_00555 [Candidatus Paceibacterota bacterium]|jgi:hypothetical protein
MRTNKAIIRRETKGSPISRVNTTITTDEVRILAQAASAIFNQTDLPKKLFNKVDKEILPKFKGNKLPSGKGRGDAFLEIANYFGLDTQIPLRESVCNGAMAMNVASQLIEEYACKTASEKATAQVVANAFVRIMENSSALRGSQNDLVNCNLVGHFLMISKELDRATRQYEAALSTLIRMKSPTFKVNVTAKTAFVAESQQFTVNHNNNENIEPK